MNFVRLLFYYVTYVQFALQDFNLFVMVYSFNVIERRSVTNLKQLRFPPVVHGLRIFCLQDVEDSARQFIILFNTMFMYFQTVLMFMC